MSAQAWAKRDNLHELLRPITGLEMCDRIQTHTHVKCRSPSALRPVSLENLNLVFDKVFKWEVSLLCHNYLCLIKNFFEGFFSCCTRLLSSECLTGTCLRIVMRLENISLYERINNLAPLGTSCGS